MFKKKAFTKRQKIAAAILIVIAAGVAAVSARVLTFAPITELPALLDYEMEEKLPFKTKIAAIDSILNYYVFQDSGKDTVVRGKDGWFFYGDTISDYKNVGAYSDEELAHIAQTLNTVEERLEEMNTHLTIFIAPNKASIYGEYFPDYYVRQPDASRVEKMVDYLRSETNVDIVFPLEELKEAAKDREHLLYYKTDTHWDYLGGYYGSQALLKEFGITLPAPTEDMIIKKTGPMYRWNGYDLINIMGINDVYTDKEETWEVVNFSDTNVEYADGIDATDYMGFNFTVSASSDAPDERKVVLLRDSFATAMMPYIASSFRSVYSPYMWGNDFYKTIEEQQPDEVILVMVERYDFLYVLDSIWGMEE